MKQKIFSLLVFMLAAVSTAWADGVTYNVTLKAACPDLYYADQVIYSDTWTPNGDNNNLLIPIGNFSSLIQAYDSRYTNLSPYSKLNGQPVFVGWDSDEGLSVLFDGGSARSGLRNDVYLTLQMGENPEDIREEAILTLSVSHSVHSNSSSQESITSWQWTKNATHHWLECDEYGKCEYAGLYGTLTDTQWAAIESWAHRAAHSDSNSDNVCDDCNYQMAAPAHVHSFSSDWIKTETKHFHPCTASADCPLASDHGLDIPMNNDDFSNAWEALSDDEKNAMAYSGHLDVDNDGICNICEYHMHLFSDWTADGNKHYKKCVVDGCTLTIENYRDMTVDGMVYEDHTYDLQSGTPCVCTKCGHLNHDVADVYAEGTDDGHYLPCMRTGCPKKSATLAESAFTDEEKIIFHFGAHVGTLTCETCGKTLNSMVDPQHSHSFEPVVYGHNDHHHWKVCQEAGCTIDYTAVATWTAITADNADLATTIGWAEHTFDTETQLCTVCELLNPTHTHVLQALYYPDGADGHYANCKYPDCPLTLAWKKEHSSEGWYSAHVDGNNDGRCDACYYLMNHQHSPSNEWVKDETIHYHPCLSNICPFHLTNKTATDFANDQYAVAALSAGEHRYGKSQDTATGSDVSGSGYYTCKDCSYVNADRQSETHTHSYGPWVSTPDTQEGSDIVPGKHWKECDSQVGPCDQVKDEEGDHDYDDTAADSKYYTCSTCGYTSTLRKNDPNRPHAHQISGAWTKTEDTDVNTSGAHYHKCTANGCTLDYTDLSADDKTLTSYATHTYGNNQQGPKYYTCQVCGYVSNPRKTQTHDHSYGTTWETNADKHWHVCTSADGVCNAPRGDENSHVYGTEGDARWTCQVCDYVNTARKKAIEAAADAATTMAWMWDYEIPFTFFADNILNDRRMKAGQCYTVCLPYALPINGMKVYYVEQSSESLVGFHEQTLTELPYLTPCVVLPSATSNPLSVAGGYVIKTDTIAKRDSVKMAAIGTNGKHNFMGSLRYINGDKGTDKWILQAADTDHPEGSFKKIQGTDGAFDNANNRACILPMRAYIGAAASTSPSRIGVRIYSADNSTTVIDRLVIDEDGAPVIFDLQGRRVQNPRKGGLYIINGRKAVLK